MYSALAAVVLAAHLLFILWIIFGAAFTRQRPLLRWLHLGSLVWGILIEILVLRTIPSHRNETEKSVRKGPIRMKSNKGYYRVMLGQKSVYAEECFAGNFIGTDFGIDQDVTSKLPEEWRVFNQQFIPIYLAKHPEKTKIGAGLACGALRTVSKGIKQGDVVLCPDGSGQYRVGEVSGDYSYEPSKILFHRRPVHG